MAAYEAEATIAEAIASVRAQTYANWELVVVDDGSADSTAAIVDAIGDDRIVLLREPHVGVLGQVRNRGVARARGDAIALLDADDVWLPQKLERQITVLTARPAAGVIHTRAAPLVEGVRGVAAPRPPRGPLFASLLENNFVFSSSAVVRRSLIGADAFDPDPALDGSPDYDLWLRLAPRTEFVYVDEVLVLYRVHDAQMSMRAGAMNAGALLALERTRERDPELVARARASYRLGRGMRRCLAGERGRGRRDLAAAVLLRPWNGRAWAWLARSLLAGRR